MVGDAAKFFALTAILIVCVLATDAGPCFSLTSQPAPVIVLAAGPERHVIKAGDTVNLLAQRYGVSTAAILKANPGLNPARLQLGKVIVIPAGGQGERPQAAPATPAAPTGLELRPEKAPQATQPLAAAPKEHDLSDAPGTAPAPSQAGPAPRAAAPAKPTPAAAPETSAAAPQEGARNAMDTLRDNAAATLPVEVQKVGDRTRLAIGGKAFFADQMLPWALSLGSRLLSAVVMFVVGLWISARLAGVLVRMLRGRKIPPEVLSFVGSLVRYGLYLVVAIATLGQMGLNVSSLLALFGAAGLALSLALKDTLANFASGVMLLLFRFFRVGDRVSVPGAVGADGTVVAIEVFNTVIRSDAGDVIIVPNSKIVGNVIVVSASAGANER